MREQIINYLRSRRVEPTENDIKFFAELVKWELEDKTEALELMVDNAHSALAAVLGSGICMAEHEEMINKGLSNKPQN